VVDGVAPEATDVGDDKPATTEHATAAGSGAGCAASPVGRKGCFSSFLVGLALLVRRLGGKPTSGAGPQA
jgi:hypothetical protein